MNANAQKSSSCLANQDESLTIFDAPNVCQELMDKCQLLAAHSDPVVAKLAGEIGLDAKRMLDAIVASVDQILAMEGGA